MLGSTPELLKAAEAGGYALGAFNVYNLEGVNAVIAAGEKVQSPVMLQVHPAGLKHGGVPLLKLCLVAAELASIPVAVHLDHVTSPDDIHTALRHGVESIMVDGSHLTYTENLAFTREMTILAHAHGAVVEAELGRLSGTEDGLTVAEYEAQLTNPHQATEFVRDTGIDALAVCVGNVHGHYAGAPKLDFERLAAIRDAVPVPLVMHGASGLSPRMIAEVIRLGVCKFNVNTEVREAYVRSLRYTLSLTTGLPDLLVLMRAAQASMERVIMEKLQIFGEPGNEIDPEP